MDGEGGLAKVDREMRIWVGVFCFAWMAWGFVFAASRKGPFDTGANLAWVMITTFFAGLTATGVWGLR